ncbi:uncharacterized protein LOC110695805 [Chenopodium quinoa]|uniref:uncharacterized protein LOC110695805 n=1 Tax=Chenopodium quinoa TaxID=63459 RepID=UPI000B77FACB|nr:uncharacterized protein LOC110695805 [Chenopodium quinoa]
MNEFDGGRRGRAWNYYTSSSDIPTDIANPPQITQSYNYKQEGPRKNIWGTTSFYAISFGFVATAILISMFLVMAILQRLYRPTNDPSLSSTSSSSSQDGSSIESGSSAKPRNHHNVVMPTYAANYSVVMPGQKYPTCLAQPAPLLPYPREGFRWNSHRSFDC